MAELIEVKKILRETKLTDTKDNSIKEGWSSKTSISIKNAHKHFCYITAVLRAYDANVKSSHYFQKGMEFYSTIFKLFEELQAVILGLIEDGNIQSVYCLKIVKNIYFSLCLRFY